ncbi:14600_t:CDS:1, partial [Racocetra fulgida]
TQIGSVPSSDHFASVLITKPDNNCVIPFNKSFIIEFKYTNFEAGQFSNKDTEFLKFPQEINTNGDIIGHFHITIQKIPSKNNVPDPKTFAFFTPLNYPPNSTFTYQVPIPGLADEGIYRACTYTTSRAHAGVNLASGDRGPIDDCIRFQVCKN